MRGAILSSIYGLALWLGTAGSGHAGNLPVYRPQAQVSGTIRIWGSLADGRLIERLVSGFRRHEPGVKFRVTLHGPESTFAAVYMDVADIGFMAREIRVPLEMMGFEWLHHYPPFEIAIANAGVGARHGAVRPDADLAFFVSKANPLVCVTLRQLDDIFAADHRRGGRNIRYWGALVPPGSWAKRPIHVYGPPLDNISAVYVRQSVLDGSRKWNPRYRIIAGGWNQLLQALARDPDGISFAPPLAGNPGVRALRVAARDGGPCYPLTEHTVEAGTYPLIRTFDVALDRAPQTALKPAVREFLRFILSREGQHIIAASGAYWPLNAAILRRQRQRLQ